MKQTRRVTRRSSPAAEKAPRKSPKQLKRCAHGKSTASSRSHTPNPDMLELVARSTPLLFIDRYIPGCAIPAVISNSAPGIKAALKALASRGHKKVGYLAGPQTTSTGLERLKEFQRFSEDLGMEQVIHHGGYLYEEGFTGTQKLLEQQPTAI